MNTKEATKKRFPFPLIGSRILKTATAVFICLIIHVLRGYQGSAAESAIAAIICMQPYAKDTKEYAVNRVAGTIMGGFWGLSFLLFMKILPDMPHHMILAYAIMSIGVILSVYSCVVLNISDAAALSAVVFLCIVVTYPEVDSPLRQTLLRILDTFIGVLVAVVVNSYRIPTKKQPNKLFFLHLNHLAQDRYSRISSRILIELNRLYDEGARICLETQYAPAFLISQLQMVHINMPIIVMGGAALYDIRENAYLGVQDIPHKDADYLYDLIESLGYCGVIFTIRGNSMLLFHVGNLSRQEEENYQLMRRSPYRNYMKGKYGEEDKILAIRLILTSEQGEAFEKLLMGNLMVAESFHVVKIPRPRHQGEVLFYFYKKGVSIENMEEQMIAYEKENIRADVKPVRINPISAVYDADRDGMILLHRIKRHYLRPYWKKK